MPSLPKEVALFLEKNPDKKFTSREIALEVISEYKDKYEEKKKKPRFEGNEKAFIQQIQAEISTRREQIKKHNEQINFNLTPRPMLFWYETGSTNKFA